MFMQFNQEQAMGEIGGGRQVGGAYVGTITATWGKGNNGSMAEWLELNLDSQDGKFNYIKLNYKDKEGKEQKSGLVAIQNIMGILGLNSLSQQQAGNDNYGNMIVNCPELNGAPIGLFLQRRDYTYNNKDKFGWNVKAVFDSKTMQTYKEKATNEEATRVAWCVENIKDIDDRKPVGQAQPTNQQPQQGGWGTPAQGEQPPMWGEPRQ